MKSFLLGGPVNATPKELQEAVTEFLKLVPGSAQWHDQLRKKGEILRRGAEFFSGKDRGGKNWLEFNVFPWEKEIFLEFCRTVGTAEGEESWPTLPRRRNINPYDPASWE